jgi:predicted enzyme related to lactoylglutathione lyase
MLKNAKTFSSFSVDDLEEARKFYGKTLGLKVEDAKEMEILWLHLEGSKIMVYPKPNHEPATFTVLNFVVDDVEKTVDSLTEKGIKFEQYDMKWIKTDEKGISHGGDKGPTIAWFKDPAGNIISVLQGK